MSSPGQSCRRGRFFASKLTALRCIPSVCCHLNFQLLQKKKTRQWRARWHPLIKKNGPCHSKHTVRIVIRPKQLGRLRQILFANENRSALNQCNVPDTRMSLQKFLHRFQWRGFIACRRFMAPMDFSIESGRLISDALVIRRYPKLIECVRILYGLQSASQQGYSVNFGQIFQRNALGAASGQHQCGDFRSIPACCRSWFPWATVDDNGCNEWHWAYLRTYTVVGKLSAEATDNSNALKTMPRKIIFSSHDSIHDFSLQLTHKVAHWWSETEMKIVSAADTLSWINRWIVPI